MKLKPVCTVKCYTNSDGTLLVPEGDPRALQLFCTPGRRPRQSLDPFDQDNVSEFFSETAEEPKAKEHQKPEDPASLVTVTDGTGDAKGKGKGKGKGKESED